MEIPVALKKQYLTRRAQDLECFAVGLEQKDFEPFKRIGHQLKGNALTYGFPDLGALGAEMEIAANEGNWSLISTLVGKYKGILTSIQNYPLK